MYSLVVFDLDGTLIDSIDDLWLAVNRLVIGHGGRELAQDEVARMVGEGAKLLVGRALAASGARIELDDALPRFLEIYDSLLPGQTRPYAGIPRVLEEASRICPLAVLTNKPTDAARKILGALDLAARFAAVVGGDGPFRRKPHPEGLLHLARSTSSRASDTLLVGDSSVDVQTAHNAGTGVCVARYGFGQATFNPDDLHGDELFVDRPEELLAVIRGAGS